ncbi:hypothetical protein MBLNU230_g7697t1 [Neophaeotheca triangularis]
MPARRRHHHKVQHPLNSQGWVMSKVQREAHDANLRYEHALQQTQASAARRPSPTAVGESMGGRERFGDLRDYPPRPSVSRRPSIFDAPAPPPVRPSMYETRDVYISRQGRSGSTRPPSPDRNFVPFETPRRREPREPHYVPPVERQPLFGESPQRISLPRRLSSSRSSSRHPEPAPSYWPSYDDGARYDFDPQPRRQRDVAGRATPRFEPMDHE